jgi:hypothetical protein
MLFIGALAAYILWLQSHISVEEFQAQTLGDSDWNQLVIASATLVMAGLLVGTRDEATNAQLPTTQFLPNAHALKPTNACSKEKGGLGGGRVSQSSNTSPRSRTPPPLPFPSPLPPPRRPTLPLQLCSFWQLVLSYSEYRTLNRKQVLQSCRFSFLLSSPCFLWCL